MQPHEALKASQALIVFGDRCFLGDGCSVRPVVGRQSGKALTPGAVSRGGGPRGLLSREAQSGFQRRLGFAGPNPAGKYSSASSAGVTLLVHFTGSASAYVTPPSFSR